MKKILLLSLGTLVLVNNIFATTNTVQTMLNKAQSKIMLSVQDPYKAAKDAYENTNQKKYVPSTKLQAGIYITKYLENLLANPATAKEAMKGNSIASTLIPEEKAVYERSIIGTDIALDRVFNQINMITPTEGQTVPQTIIAFDAAQLMLNYCFEIIGNFGEQYCKDNSSILVYNATTQHFTSQDPLAQLYNHMISAVIAEPALKKSIVTYMVACAQECKTRYLTKIVTPVSTASRLRSLFRRYTPIALGMTAAACSYMMSESYYEGDGAQAALITGAAIEGAAAYATGTLVMKITDLIKR